MLTNKKVCDIINGGFNNKNLFNDYKLAPVMICAFDYNHSEIQFQPWFCYVCGDYTMSFTHTKYGGLEKIICTDKNHEEINEKHHQMFNLYKEKERIKLSDMSAEEFAATYSEELTASIPMYDGSCHSKNDEEYTHS